MEWILLPLAIVVALGAATLLVGTLLPRQHLAASTVRLTARPRRVWELVRDFAEQPAWRPDILEVERLPEVNGRAVWRERGTRGSMTFVVDEYQPPRRMTIRIADKDLGFGGSWTYDVAEEGDGARLTIVERGEIHRPAYRFLSRFLFGHHAAMHQYLEALGRALGETPTPEKLRDPSRIEDLLAVPAAPAKARRSG